jgi:hypothetical protein
VFDNGGSIQTNIINTHPPIIENINDISEIINLLNQDNNAVNAVNNMRNIGDVLQVIELIVNVPTEINPDDNPDEPENDYKSC